MDNYTSLVSKVLENKLLAKAVDDLVDEQCLNLVDPEWLSRLENNITYQDFLSHSKKLFKPSSTTANYEYEDSNVPNFQVILVGYCKLGTLYKGSKPNLVVMNSEPLAKIARAMTSDLGPHVQISNDFKFSFTDCGLVGCNDCIKYTEVFQNAGYKINQLYQPCIADTKIYDGKRIVNRFYSQFEAIFKKTFVAILHLDISNRYSFQNSNKQKVYRVSGVILNFIGFPESKLTLSKKVDVGPLVRIEKPSLKDDIKNPSAEAIASEKVNDIDDFEDFVENLKEENGKRKVPEDNVENEKIKMAKLTEEELLGKNYENDDTEDFLTDEDWQTAQQEKEAKKRKFIGECCEIDQLILI